MITSRPIHPGEHLAEELRELELTAAAFARHLQVPASRITQILNGRRAISGDTALRLAHFFGTSSQFWMNLRGGSGNSDSVVSGSLASPKPPAGGEPEERGDEETTTESRGHV